MALRQRTDSERAGLRAHAEAGRPDYKAKVAEPVMNAIDAMPAPYRRLVHELDYVDVYRAWRSGVSVEAIDAFAQRHGGVFDWDRFREARR